MDFDETGDVPLEDLLKAAEAGDPLHPSTEAAAARTAEAGLKLLSDALAQAEAAQDAREAIRLVSRLMGDDEAMRALAYAHLLKEGKLKEMLRNSRGLYSGFAGTLDEIDKLAKKAADKLEADIKRRASQESKQHQSRITDALTRDLGIKGLKVPNGYRLEHDGVTTDSDPPERITHAPILITGLSQDIHTGEMHVDLSWRRKGRWHTRSVARDTIMDARAIVRLSAVGAPVSTIESRDLVKFLRDFEAANLGVLPQRETTTHMGWQSDKCFVLGGDHVGDPVQLAAAGGLEALARGYRPKGTFEGWRDTVAELLADRPLPLLGMYASACTVLLHHLRQPGFVIDFSGETSMGKTTTLRGAASLWGEPDDRGEGIILSWASSSMVGPMAVAHFLQSLPVMLDDTKRGRPDVVASVLYDLPAGQERMKGNVDGGLRPVRRWRTCLLSTGEAPITSISSKDGGARARTLILRGAPFGEPSEENRRAAEAVTLRLLQHHGHLGPRVLAYLLDSETKVENLRRRFERYREEYASEAPSAVAGRLAAYVAILRVAKDLCEHLGMPRPRDCDPIGLAWKAALDSATQSDPNTEALRDLYAWIVGNETRFWYRHEKRGDDPIEPHGGFIGSWVKEGWTEIAIHPQVATRLLAEWGYDAPSVIETWNRRGWTCVEEAGGRKHYSVRRYIRGLRSRMIGLRRDAIEKVCGAAGEEDEVSLAG